MVGSFIITLFYAVIATSLLFGLINLIRSNFYDIRQAKLRRQVRIHPHARNLRRRPLVSVIVFAANDAATIETSLKSLITSSYRKLEILVVDNASTDGTPKLVRRFIKDNPKHSVGLMAKRRSTIRAAGLVAGSKKLKGEFILTIDASCLLDRHTIRNLVIQMNQSTTSVSLANVQIEHNYRLLGLADKIRALAAIGPKKAGDFIEPGFDAYNYVAMYTKMSWQLLKSPVKQACLDNLNSLHQTIKGIAYEESAQAKSYKSHSLLQLPKHIFRPVDYINTVRSILAILEPVIVGFMLYVAIRFNQPGYIILAWLSFTSLLILAIWSDTSQASLTKLRLSLLALVAYTLYVMSALVAYAKAAALVLNRTISRAISSSMAAVR